MKELSVEEKAKAYDEALERMKSWARGEHPECFTEAQKAAEFIFPELKEESEDEKIRKVIMKIVDVHDENSYHFDQYSKKKCLAWLEKQGEQKSADKVEPKFHEGEWVTNGNYTWKIVEVKPLDYILQSQDGNIVDDTISHVDEQFHSFTIEDAKDGDVVVDKSDWAIGIFQSIGHHPDGGSYNDPSYCFLHCRYDDGFFYADFENGNTMDSDDVIPATKEQRDFLFAKIKEAGYEWDAEKKELMKIKQKPVEKVEPKFKVGDWLIHNERKHIVKVIHATSLIYEVVNKFGYHHTITNDAIKNNYHLWTIQDAVDGDVLIDESNGRECPFIFKETKPSNIKTDVLNPLSVLGYCGIGGAGFTKGSGWGDTANCIYYPATKEQRDTLMKAMADAGYTFDFENKELKKIEQKSSWSEEDEKMMSSTVFYLNEFKEVYQEGAQKCISWLKSLRPQSHWKPSDEQMEYLLTIKTLSPSPLLESLYIDLKKLKEE